MARMPGAVWRPLASNFANQPRIKSFDLVVIHTAVGSLEGTFSHFASANGAGYAGTESHFMTGGKGQIHQYQDTAYQAEANGAGNHRIISVENADIGPEFPKWNLNDGAAVPAFTPEQIEANAQILAWAHREHGIPLELVPDSKPGRRGIGYHRLGVPGYAVPGGELWSSARGKVCPGARRIAQIPQIIARARQIVGGAPATPQEDWMTTPISAENLDKIRRAVLHASVAPNGDLLPGHPWFAARVAGGDAAANAALVEARALRGALDGLVKLVAEQNGLRLDDVRKVVSQEVAAGVKVAVSVNGSTSV